MPLALRVSKALLFLCLSCGLLCDLGQYSFDKFLVFCLSYIKVGFCLMQLKASVKTSTQYR